MRVQQRMIMTAPGRASRRHSSSSKSLSPVGGFTVAAAATATGSGEDAGGGTGGSSVDSIRILQLQGADVGALSDVLLSLGATSCSVEDADLGTDAEEEIYFGDDRVWHQCNVTAMFAPGADIPSIMADVEDVLQAKVNYTVETIPDNDWVNVVLDSFKPVKVLDGLWIVPAWSEKPDYYSEGQESVISVVLEPGLAFGTGEHPTTRLCLGWLRKNNVEDEYVMDFGTGSGVLAIGALLMGASRAVGVDIDPVSVKSARTNAALNGIEDKVFELYCADGSDDALLPPGRGDVDTMVANILVGPVMDLEPLFAAYVKPGTGRVCLSGILVEQAPRVIERYSEHFDDLSYEEENGWAVVSGVRKPE